MLNNFGLFLSLGHYKECFMNIDVCLLVHNVSIYFGFRSRNGIMGHSHASSVDTLSKFTNVFVPIYISISIVGEFQLLYILSNTQYCPSFSFESFLWVCGGSSLVLICTLLRSNYIDLLFTCIMAIHTSFVKYLYESCLFLWSCLSFLIMGICHVLNTSPN